METQYARGRFASQAPAWNKDDGIYRLVNIDGVDKYVLTPPNIKIICEPLMGVSVRTGEGWKVKYLPVDEQIALYAKALRIIVKWNLREDLLNLALYRRQIMNSDPIDVDDAFLVFACSVQPALRPAEWRLIMERMPEPSFIRGFCRLTAQAGTLRDLTREAA